MEQANKPIDAAQRSSDPHTKIDIKRVDLTKEHVLREKTRLFNNLAYQIRTLANAIVGFSELLSIEPLSPSQEEYVNEIRQSGLGMSSIVDEVLDLAQLNCETVQLVKDDCDLNRLINEVYSFASSAAHDKQLQFGIYTDQGLPQIIRTDKQRLLRCLKNLVSNSIKYTQEGFIRINITLQNNDLTDEIRFDVIDSGIGIASEKLERVFDLDNSENFDVANGILSNMSIGLSIAGGLPMTRHIVELLDGQLTVKSQQNIGSVFSLVIPAGLDIAQQTPLGQQTYNCHVCQIDLDQELPAPHIGRSRVLLVEDKESNRTVISLMLKSFGLEIETACDGLEGVEKTVQNDYDLILMDLRMPKMDGWTAAEKIRRTKKDIPIIALSAKVLSEQDNERLTQWFNHFVTKPIEGQKLYQIISEYISIESSPEIETEIADDSPTDDVVIQYG